ncbi:MAG: GDP-L-fucose synthase family protein [Burkholderiales bacterium]
MNKQSKIYVAGHTGMVGSAIVRCLLHNGFENIVLRTHEELDLKRQQNVEDFFADERPEYVFIAAAKVGGIISNQTYPAEYITDNLLIECNLIESVYRFGVKKLLFLGSSCIYPKVCPQPIREEYLLTGPLESSNEAYALAKIAGIRMCKHYRTQYGVDFITLMPASIYGENDNFDINHSHVIPAMIVKMHTAKLRGEPSVTLWGTGAPLREFLYVDDLADACLFLMENYTGDTHINVGTGIEISIRDLAHMIKSIVGYEGDIVFDASKPDGTMRKVLDTSALSALGWAPKVNLEEGLKREYAFYLNTIKAAKSAAG